MRRFLIVFLVLFSNLVSAQKSQITDSLLSEVCNSITTSQIQEDSSKIMAAFQLHIAPYLNEVNETEFNDLILFIHLRLQRNCPVYNKIIVKLDPPKGDWKFMQSKPVSQSTNEECRVLRTFRKLSYMEPDGGHVAVDIHDEVWEEHFENGTFSRLKMYWIDSCNFQLEFIESNNSIRKNLSKKGDKYNYEVLKKEEGYFLMSTHVAEQAQFYTFHLYF